MFAGFVAVFAAIFYKINSNSEDAADVAFAKSVTISRDADILQVSESDGILLVLVREGETRSVLRFDSVTGNSLGRTEFSAR